MKEEKQELLRVPAIISKFGSMADGGYKLAIDTQEIGPEDVASLASLKNKIGWFVFKINKIAITDIPEEEAPEFNSDKSPAQSIRGKMFVWFTHKNNPKGGKKEDFNEYYRKQKEKESAIWSERIDELE